MKALSVQNLHKSYGNFEAIKGISFDIEQGDFFGFLGPNGAGKTTTINCIIGLAKFSGSINVFGKDIIKDFREARRLVGTSSQEYNFDYFLDIESPLLYQAGYFGIRKRDAQPKVDELLKQFKLEGKSQVDFRKLSGGMKRRLTIARALVHSPKLLILDEPTAGVDVELRHEIHNYLKKLNKEGTTILLTSHYLDEVEKLCNTVCIVHHGEIIANEPTSQLITRLDDGHTEILTDKIPKPIKMQYVEFQKNKVIILNRGKSQLKDVLSYLQKQKIKVVDVKNVKDSLEKIFLRLTSNKKGGK